MSTKAKVSDLNYGIFKSLFSIPAPMPQPTPSITQVMTVLLSTSNPYLSDRW
ncbi:MAG: hypothetical protein ACAF41_07795 [Leptolyngbya sp. BL-A-14]